MKFGLIYEICRPEPFEDWASEEETYWQALEQCVLAEEVGFDYVWEVEHHFLEGYSLSSAPEVFLASLAQHTNRVRIGHGVRLLPPPFNHPVRSAEAAAALDIMSRGRLEFGVGRSITEQELGGFGIDPADSRPMLDEVLPEIVKMWTENEYPGFEGRYFSMPPRVVLPKPVQQPHPPLWMACTQPASFDLAAEFGIGVLAFGVGAPGDVVESVKRYKERIGHPTRQAGLVVNNAVAPATMLFCADDQRKAIEMGGVAALWYGAQVARLFAPWAGQEIKGYEYYHQLTQDPEFLKQFARPYEERLQDRYSLVGTPDKVAEGVQSYIDVGVDQIIGITQVGRIPHDEIMASLRLFGEEVIPRFKQAAEPATASAR